MSAMEQTTNNEWPDSLRFAELGEGVVIVQVHGRGSFANSIAFKKLADRLSAKYGPGHYCFVIDLGACATMDSTFLGALASVALRQRKECSRPLVIVNANEHTRKLLDTLGVSRFVELRSGEPTEERGPVPLDASFQDEKIPEVSKLDRILHMIEAHERLCELDSENEVRFQSVLRYLNDSLSREQKGEAS